MCIHLYNVKTLSEVFSKDCQNFLALAYREDFERSAMSISDPGSWAVWFTFMCVCMKHEEIILWYCLTGIIGHQHVPRNLLRIFNQYSHVNHTFSVIHHCEAVLSQNPSMQPSLKTPRPSAKHQTYFKKYKLIDVCWWLGDVTPRLSLCFSLFPSLGWPAPSKERMVKLEVMARNHAKN